MNTKAIIGVNPQLPYSIEEAVNRLRINVGFLGSEVRKIMVSSSEPDEGKSFIAMSKPTGLPGRTARSSGA